jgi:hypothetical protein
MKKTIIALFLIVSLLVPSVSQAMTVAEITSYISILQNLLNQILATSGGTNNLAARSSVLSKLQTRIGWENFLQASTLSQNGTLFFAPSMSFAVRIKILKTYSAKN